MFAISPKTTSKETKNFSLTRIDKLVVLIFPLCILRKPSLSFSLLLEERSKIVRTFLLSLVCLAREVKPVNVDKVDSLVRLKRRLNC